MGFVTEEEYVRFFLHAPDEDEDEEEEEDSNDTWADTLREHRSDFKATPTNEEVADGEFLVNVCKKYSIDLIVLAGYLRLIPVHLIQAFPERIINIHPALLPKYGGKNMYGDKVHQAIVDANETETGITIHFVNEQFDKGKIIAQYVCPVHPTDSIDDVRENVQHLEHTFFPFVVEKVIKELKFAPRRAR
jgi:phosphoribosylglycinamide formyltransferase-1